MRHQLKETGDISLNKTLKISLFISVVVLSSCSMLNNNRIAMGYTEAFRAIDQAIFGFDDYEITRAMVDNIPYASSLLKIGRGPRGLMILESINGDEETWVSADGIYIVIRSGRIIQTRGFQNNLTSFISQLDLRTLLQDESKNYIFYYSYDKPRLNNLQIRSSITRKENIKISILGKEKDLILYEENLSNSYLGWNVTNKFWVDEDNFVWRSEQFISPKLPKVIIEVTKKPS